MRFLLLGYYGFFNSGDDAILHAVCQDIKSQDSNCQITVMSNSPESTEKEYGVRAIRRYDLLSVFREMRKADIVIFGGGSLLQDVTSSRSLQYYLTVMKMATKLKKKTMLYANGVGPINNPDNQKATIKVLNKLTKLTVRDTESYEFLCSNGIDKSKLTLTADPVYNIQTEKNDVDVLLERHNVYNERPKYVAVVFRSFGNDTKYIKKVAQVCDRIYDTMGMDILFTPMEFPNDYELSKKIQMEMNSKSYTLKEREEVPKLIDVIGNAHLVLGMRLHGLIYASVRNTPMVSFSYDPKIDSFCKQMEIDANVNFNDFDVEEVVKMVQKILANYEEKKTTLDKNLKIMQDKSKINREVLNELMKG